KQIAPAQAAQAAEEKVTPDEEERRERNVGLPDRAVSENVRIEAVQRERAERPRETEQLAGPKIDENPQYDADEDHRELCVEKHLLGVVIAKGHAARQRNRVVAVFREPVPVRLTAGIFDVERQERQSRE